MKIKEIMTLTIKAHVKSTVSEAARLMAMKNIGSLLIEENDKVIGIITERDILKKIIAKDKDPKNTQVKEIMSSPLMTLNPESSVEEANEIMTQNKIRRLPVESDGEIVGIVTIRDTSNNIRYSLGQRLIGNGESSYSRPSYGKPT